MHGFSHQKGRKAHRMGKAWKIGSGEILQNPSYVEKLGNWYSYFSHSMCAFFPLDSHPLVHFIICEIHGFPHQFPMTWENAAKSIELEELGNWSPFFPQSMGIFLPSDFHFMIYFTTWEMHGFSHQFLIARENVAKPTL